MYPLSVQYSCVAGKLILYEFSCWIQIFFSHMEFLKNIMIFYSLKVATILQKYRELSIQVENCE